MNQYEQRTLDAELLNLKPQSEADYMAQQRAAAYYNAPQVMGQPVQETELQQIQSQPLTAAPGSGNALWDKMRAWFQQRSGHANQLINGNDSGYRDAEARSLGIR